MQTSTGFMRVEGVIFHLTRCEEDAEAVGPACNVDFLGELAIRVYSCTSTGDT